MKQQEKNQLVAIAIFSLEQFGNVIVSDAIREDFLKECKSRSLMVSGGAFISGPIALLNGITINLDNLGGQIFYV